MAIVQEYVEIKIAPSNHRYWKEKGYDLRPTGGYAGKNNKGQSIRVRVSELQPKSMVMLDCRCDKCGIVWKQRRARNTDVCSTCRTKDYMTGNRLGEALKGRKIPSMTGELHPNWNPNKNLYRRFQYRVQRLTEETYAKHEQTINPDKHPRTLCGVDGGYQLDHIVSIKSGFEQGMTPLQLADLSNLQMLPWKTNRDKWHG